MATTSAFWDKVSEISAAHGLSLNFNPVRYEFLKDGEEEGEGEVFEEASYFLDEYGNATLKGISVMGKYFVIKFHTFYPITDHLNSNADALFYLEVAQDERNEENEDVFNTFDVEKTVEFASELVAVAKAKKELRELFSSTKMADVDFVKINEEGEVEFFKGDLTKIVCRRNFFSNKPVV